MRVYIQKSSVTLMVILLVLGSGATAAAALETSVESSETGMGLPARFATGEDPTAAEMAGTHAPLEAGLHFEPNLGQSDPEVAFLAQTGGYTFFLTDREAVFVLAGGPVGSNGVTDDGTVPQLMDPDERGPDRVVRMRFVDTSEKPEITGQGVQSGVSNHLLGDDPDGWTTNVPHYDEVLVEDLWPGIDMVFMLTSQGAVRFDLHVHPGADPDRIGFDFEGAEPRLDETGGLVLDADETPILLFPAPVTFQEEGAAVVEVPSGYTLDDQGGLGFKIGAYDPGLLLVVDPAVLDYASYHGGTGTDVAHDIALGEDGHLYVTGRTSSSDFPIQGGYQTTHPGGTSAFVTKFRPGGDEIVYSTFVGGGGFDEGQAIAVDDAGQAYVHGRSSSPNFPTVNAFMGSNPGSSSGFVFKLGDEGDDLVYSTYLGGDSFEFAADLALDPSGHVYVTGITESMDFPTENALQPGHPDPSCTDFHCETAYVTKLGQDGDTLVYSTYLGGDSRDNGHSIAVDGSGNAYITGETRSADFPIHNAYIGTKPSLAAAFVTKLAPSGDSLVFSTFLGGSSTARGKGITVDDDGHAYVTGHTFGDFPLKNAFQDTFPGQRAGFITKFTQAGDDIVYSTYLGGSENFDDSEDIAVAADGHAYVVGSTPSLDFPIKNAFLEAHPGQTAAFVAKLTPSGSDLVFSTFIGGSGVDRGFGIAIDEAGVAYIVGQTDSTDFLVTSEALQDTKPGSISGFIGILSFPHCVAPGPDAYGYTCTTTDSSFIDGFTGNNLTLGDDEVSSPIDLTNGGDLDPFLYYGRAYDELRISSNGFVTFSDSTDPGCCAGAEFPDAGAPNAVVGGYWTDLAPQFSTEVQWGFETDPDRFVVQFDEVSLGTGPHTATFQIVLDYTTFEVLVPFGPIAGHDDFIASTGIEDHDGSTGLSFDHGAYHSPGNGIMDDGDGVYLNLAADDSAPEGVEENDIRIAAFDGSPNGAHVATTDADHAYGLVLDVATVLCYFDEDADLELDVDEPLYLANDRLDCGSVQEGDLRLTTEAGQDPGSFVDSAHADAGNPLEEAPGSRLMYTDVAGNGQFSAGDPVYLKASGGILDEVEAGDFRLTSTPNAAAFTWVAAGNTDQGTALQAFAADPHIDTPNVLAFYDSQKRTVAFGPPTPSVPSVPLGLDATIAADNTVTLSWDAPDDNGMSHLSTYHVYRGETEGSIAAFDSVNASLGSYEDSTVQPGETWFYAVAAENGVGEGSLSDALQVDAFDVPTPPENLVAATGPGVGEITLDWDAPADDGGQPVSDYHVYCSETEGGPYSLVDTVVAEVTTYTQTGLSNGLTRYCVVAAENSVGEGEASQEATATTFDVPGAPQNLVAATGPGVGEITLDWDAPEDDGGLSVTDYLIEGSDTEGGPYDPLGSVDGNVFNFTETDLESADPRYYVVYAENDADVGPASNEASAVGFLPPGPPTAFDVTTGPEPGTIQVSWQPPEDDGGLPIGEYRIYGGDAPGSTLLIDAVPANDTTFLDAGLGDAVERFYNVTAVTDAGQGNSTGTLGSSTQPPGEPESLPAGTSATSAIFKGNYAYVFGGRSEDNTTTDAIVRFDPSTGNVTTLNATLPSARLGTSAVWVDEEHSHELGVSGCDPNCFAGRGFIFGGTGDPLAPQGAPGAQLEGHEILEWIPGELQVTVRNATFPEARFGTSAVWDKSSNLSFIFGGFPADGDGGGEGHPGVNGCHPNCAVGKQIMVYDGELDELTQHEDELPAALGGTSAVWDANQAVAYIFGGLHQHEPEGAGIAGCDPNCARSIFLFDPFAPDEAGSFVEPLPVELPGDRWNTSATFDGQYAYVFGGENETGFIDEIVRFDPVNETVEIVGALPTNRTQTSAIHDGISSFIIGGLEADNLSTDEIVRFTPTAPQEADAQPGPGAGETTVTWSGPADDGGAPVESYRVYREEGDGLLQRVATLPVSNTTFVDSGLENGTLYRYRVTAVNEVGEGLQSPFAVATTFDKPSAPQALSGYGGPGQGEITLSWQPGDDGGTPVTSFRIYGSDTSGGPFSLVGVVPGNESGFTESGLDNLQTRYYEVTAVNLVGEGDGSVELETQSFDPMNIYLMEGGGLTLQQALDALAPGGTIHMAPGLYEAEVLAQVNATIQEGTPEGFGGFQTQDRPVILGSIHAVGTANLTIRDLQIEAKKDGVLPGVALLTEAVENLLLENNTFQGDGAPTGTGSYPGLMDLQGVARLVMANSTVRGDPSMLPHSSGLRIEYAPGMEVDVLLRDNSFDGLPGAGVVLEGNNPGAVIRFEENHLIGNGDGLVALNTAFGELTGDDNRVLNNTGIGVRYVGTVTGDSAFRHNHFVGNGIGFALSHASDPVDARHNWWGSPGGPLLGDQANMLLVEYTPWCIQEDCALNAELEPVLP